MRRWMIVAATATALTAALAVGPLGTTAAAPYVYGCTPAKLVSQFEAYTSYVTIYNGSASTASVIHKILAGDGTILNDAVGPPLSSSLPPTHTKYLYIENPSGTAGEANATIPASVRIVSNVPLSATLSHQPTDSLSDLVSIVCTPQQP